jgi:hypothetical protein
MSANARTELQSNAIKLAALKAPAEVGPETAAAIESFVVASFVFGFRLMMWVCAALAIASAAVAWPTIPGRAKPGFVTGVKDTSLARVE